MNSLPCNEAWSPFYAKCSMSEFIVRFEPARPCADPHCIAMTNVGLGRQCGKHFEITPYCPRHCYLVPLRPSHEPERRKSIVNFVLSELGEQGKVLHIEPALLDELKKYDIKTRGGDDAWKVIYQPVKGRKIVCYALWLDLEEEFCLYRRKGH